MIVWTVPSAALDSRFRRALTLDKNAAPTNADECFLLNHGCIVWLLQVEQSTVGLPCCWGRAEPANQRARRGEGRGGERGSLLYVRITHTHAGI